MSATTLYSTALTVVVTVGALFTAKERFGKLTLPESTFEGAIADIYLSASFLFLAVVTFLHYAEIRKRIQFINKWGTFQVGFLLAYGIFKKIQRQINSDFI
jgi:hypothetical protein